MLCGVLSSQAPQLHQCSLCEYFAATMFDLCATSKEHRKDNSMPLDTLKKKREPCNKQGILRTFLLLSCWSGDAHVLAYIWLFVSSKLVNSTICRALRAMKEALSAS